MKLNWDFLGEVGRGAKQNPPLEGGGGEHGYFLQLQIGTGTAVHLL